MRLTISILLMFVLSVVAFGQQAGADFALRLQKHYESVKTISSDFTQLKQSPLFDEPLDSKGLFYFDRPDKIRWEQQEPSSTYFVINKDQVIQFDGESVKKSTGLNMQMSIFRQFILSTIDGSILNDKAFEKDFQPRNGKMYITLIPLDKRLAKRLQKIELKFDEKSLLLDQLKMYENADDFTEITFTDQKVNAQIPPAIFR
ncbi:outer membrane lipoprotein carrier protein LolA [Algoriphagus sp. AGSA1]|uniref:LolA family protein n=1 Tax=Algoriphagus sp. AGSA1 TaxID=2907213 RepID=UPI001F3E4DCC|nr:outer membrane lipoprotein carrier protein LolA [Algoriphagus sp. AGSA1]MCE7056459.1 outer membrane lipoprotein carrier protein LolA [Algoriphagus sp. AGSA1]